MIVVADTTPVNYLILIESIDVLLELYGRVVMPQAVFDELQSEDTPEPVRTWIAKHPAWLDVHQDPDFLDVELEQLDTGEANAIALAEQLGADAIKRDGRKEALRRKLRVIGTLRVLSDAAEKGLISLPEAFSRLQATSFRASPALLQHFWDMDAKRQVDNQESE